VIELRDKLNEFTAQSSAERVASGSTVEAPADAVFDDALSALVNLGYQRNAAEKALNQAVKEGTEMSVQKLLRKSLQLLAKG
jgi:Holliday junction DNA helicase RuvA